MKNQSLISSLPPQVQKQVFVLIKRLGDQKKLREQLQEKCLRYQKQIQELRRENNSLKAKWDTSFSIISKVRENLNNSSEKNSKWREESGKEKENKLRDNGQDDRSYRLQTSGNKKYNNHNNIDPRSPQQPKPYLLPNVPKNDSSSKTLNTSNLLNSRKLGSSNSNTKSNKKLQISNLKQQIQQLSQQIKQKQMNNMSYLQKMKRCEEIKNRYIKKNNSQEKQKQALQQQQKMQQQVQTVRVTQRSQKKILLHQGEESQSFYEDSSYQSPRKNLHFEKFLDTSKINETVTNVKKNTGMQLGNTSFYDDGLMDLIQEMNL